MADYWQSAKLVWQPMRAQDFAQLCIGHLDMHGQMMCLNGAERSCRQPLADCLPLFLWYILVIVSTYGAI